MDEFMDVRPSGQQERIVEILVFLLDEMKNNKQLTEIDLAVLSARGFSETEISTAFSWLLDKIAVAGPKAELKATSFGTEVPKIYHQRPASFRVYHESERAVLSPKVQGYLLQLRALGLLSDNELEQLVDRVVMSGIHMVDMNDIRWIVANTIFDFDDSTRLSSRMMLSVNDTIQ
jgi:uncharacterized protein Smg (DUF494 family)